MRRSVVIFARNNEVPHIATYERHQRSWKISFVTQKGLLQQYRTQSGNSLTVRNTRKPELKTSEILESPPRFRTLEKREARHPRLDAPTTTLINWTYFQYL